MRLTGYTTHEGTVNETKGDTIWLTRDGKDFPVEVGSSAEQILPGHHVRVLLSPKGKVLRLFNRATDLVYSQLEGKAEPNEAKSDAIRLAILVGIPAAGMFLGFFFWAGFLVHLASSYQPARFRWKGIRILIETAILYFIPWLAVIPLSNQYGNRGSVFVIVVVVFGPGIMAYLGIRRLQAVHDEYAEVLTRMVREG